MPDPRGASPAASAGKAQSGRPVARRRDGPFTLAPEAPMLRSGPAFISLLGDSLNEKFLWLSNHSNDGSFQGGDWKAANVTMGADGTRLGVVATGDKAKPYSLAEVQTRASYGYGRYEVVMRPSKGSGLVSSFFTYTGPYQGDPHDEIDIEFLGSDTTAIHLNYYHKGKRGQSAIFQLPFDAAEADHLYAFDWKPEGIFWYVDGRLIYNTLPGDPQVPQTAGKIMFSNWTGIPKMQAWHGKPDFGHEASAYYACISFTPLGENTRRCSDVFQAEPLPQGN
ncbi:MAG: family 16 glycosylhydrolase [Hyphomonas sp.]